MAALVAIMSTGVTYALAESLVAVFEDACVETVASFTGTVAVMSGRPGWRDLPRGSQPLMEKIKSWIVQQAPDEYEEASDLALGVTATVPKADLGVLTADCSVAGLIDRETLASALERLGFTENDEATWVSKRDHSLEVLLKKDRASSLVTVHLLRLGGDN